MPTYIYTHMKYLHFLDVKRWIKKFQRKAEVSFSKVNFNSISSPFSLLVYKPTVKMQEIHLPKKCKAIQSSEQYWKLDKFSY